MGGNTISRSKGKKNLGKKILKGLFSDDSKEIIGALEIIKGIKKINKIIKRLKKKTANKTTLEKTIQNTIYKYPWIISTEINICQKEKSFKTIIKDKRILTKYQKDIGKRRFDLLFNCYSNITMVIELKRPGNVVEADALCQLLKYRYLASKRYSTDRIESYLFGDTFCGPLSDIKDRLKDIGIILMTYEDLFLSCQRKFNSLLNLP